MQLADHAELPLGHQRDQTNSSIVKEKGIKADGPLFDLPGGTVKAAIGANYTTYNFLIQQTQTNATAIRPSTSLRIREAAGLGGVRAVERSDLR